MRTTIHTFFIPHELNDHKPYVLRPVILSATSVLILLSKVIVTLALFFSYPSPVAFAEITSRRIIELTNQSRREQNLPTLTENSHLDEAAYEKARDMLERDYFNHEDPNGEAPWGFLKKNDYLYSYAGENLAMDFVKAEDVHEAWLSSPSHRVNIMNPSYKEIGVAVVQGRLNNKKTTLLVQFFGTRFIPEEKISILTQAPSLKTPLATESLQPNTQPQLKGEKIISSLTPFPEKNFLSRLIASVKKFYRGVFLFFLIAFFINIFVKIRIQNPSVILQTIFVLLLIAIIAIIKTHFLENLDLGLSII